MSSIKDADKYSNSTPPLSTNASGWTGPAGDGEMAQRIRAFDWSSTPLGSLNQWPAALRHAVALCLESRFAMHLWWGPDLIYIYNDTQISILGERHPAALGKPAQQYWSDVWPVLQPQVEAVMQRGESTWNERVQVVTDRNGVKEDAWFTWSYSPVRDDDGTILGLLAVAVEETLRVRAEREHDRLNQLHEGEKVEEQARAILRSITDGFFALDQEWRFTFVNPQGEKILERSPGDLIGQSIWEVYPGLYESEFGLSYRRCVTERVPLSFTAYYPAHQKSYEVHSYPSPEGISVYFQDVTQRIKTQRELADTRLRLDAALETGQISTWIWDLPSNRIFSDSNISDFFNLPADHGVGLPIADYVAAIHPDDRPRITTLLEKSLQSSEDYVAEYRIITFDPPRWIYARGRVERDPDGKPLRVGGVVINISARKTSEEEREKLLASERAARSEAERAGRMKDEFLATLSHELRTPLNAVIGWCEILKGDAKDAADLAEAVEIIERNARAQSKIIADMLDMSRIISGKIRLEVERVDLAALLREAIKTSQPAADARGVRIQPILDSSSPTVSGDPNRLQQVFWNLLSNAVKFTTRGGTVQVILERVNSHLEVSIIDTGEGIDPKFLPYVFDRFRQADSSTTRRHGGLGLGLSIVKSLVELHGGSVSVKSLGPGRGSTFIVKLPSLVIHPDHEPNGAREYPHTAKTTFIDSEIRDRLKGLKILAVDDEPDARAVVKRLLEDCGAVVTTAASAQAALEQLAREIPAVLISDIGMPHEDGFSLIRKVRALAPEQGANVPAVALTAYARSEDRTRSILAGFHLHIPKPVEPTELIAVVASLARRS